MKSLDRAIYSFRLAGEEGRDRMAHETSMVSAFRNKDLEMELADLVDEMRRRPRMSLPEAMHALKTGQIPRPPNNDLAALSNDPAELPLRPAPHSSVDHALMMFQRAEAREAAEAKTEMRVHLTAKRIAAAEGQRHAEAAKYDRLISELENNQ
jgi:hypothetical protein